MNGSLFLFPEDPFRVPTSRERLLDTLRQAGMAGDQIDANGGYLAGPDLLSHITFAGCSPFVLLDPPAGGGNDFTHVRLHGPFERSRLFTTSNRSRPRCPHCRERIADWKERLAYWREDPARPWRCPGCGKSNPAATLDWRQYAAVGMLLVEIYHIFPGEAVPGDQLLNVLRQETGCRWRYAWADSSLPQTAPT